MAKKPPLPGVVTYFRSIGLVFGLLTVAAIMFLPAYFSWFVILGYAAISLLVVDLFYELRDRGRIAQGVVLLVAVVIVCAFTFGFVWIKAPLGIGANRNATQYPQGTIIGGITWNPKFNDLRVRIRNPSVYDYYDLDVLLRPDEPVAQIGQVGEFPKVDFLDPLGFRLHAEMVQGPTRREAVPFVRLASTAGYRARCEKLPGGVAVEIVMAIASVGTDKGIMVNKLSDGSRYWHGNRYEMPSDVYGPRPTPSVVHIEGQYTVLQRRRTVKEDLPVTDWVGEFTNQLPTK